MFFLVYQLISKKKERRQEGSYLALSTSPDKVRGPSRSSDFRFVLVDDQQKRINTAKSLLDEGMTISIRFTFWLIGTVLG